MERWKASLGPLLDVYNSGRPLANTRPAPGPHEQLADQRFGIFFFFVLFSYTILNIFFPIEGQTANVSGFAWVWQSLSSALAACE